MKEKIRLWILKKIRKTSVYKILKEEIISNALHNEAMIIQKMEHAESYFSNLDRTSQEVARMLHDQVMIATDVHFKSDTIIVVISRLGNGQIRFIPTSAENIGEFRQLVKHLRSAFYVSENNFITDYPHPYFDKDFYK